MSDFDPAFAATLPTDLPPINVGRHSSGGVFNGILGNRIIEPVASEQYRDYIKGILATYPHIVTWLKTEMAKGRVLSCPGCGIGAPRCHARMLEEELALIPTHVSTS